MAIQLSMDCEIRMRKMNKAIIEILNQDCLFKTNRLSVFNWEFIAPNKSTTESVLKIMTLEVTKSLPDGWQNLDTLNKAEVWIKDRNADSNFYAIILELKFVTR